MLLPLLPPISEELLISIYRKCCYLSSLICKLAMVAEISFLSSIQFIHSVLSGLFVVPSTTALHASLSITNTLKNHHPLTPTNLRLPHLKMIFLLKISKWEKQIPSFHRWLTLHWNRPSTFRYIYFLWNISTVIRTTFAIFSRLISFKFALLFALNNLYFNWNFLF